MQRPTSEGSQASGRGSPSANAESEAKRRKIRKGTRSCWECKRRKTRCNYANPDDAVCIGCRRRGMACVSQEYDEEPSQHIERAPEIGDRIVRVEALVAELVKKVGGAPGSSPWSEGMMSSRPRTPPADDVVFPGPTLLTPDDSASESGPQSMYCDDTSAESLPCCQSEDAGHDPSPTGRAVTGRPGMRLAPASAGKYQNISDALYRLLPSQEVSTAICTSGGLTSVFFQQLFTQPYTELDREGLLTPEHIAVLPPPTAHPVLIAKKMLTIATVIQYLRPDQQHLLRCSDDPRLGMQRMVDAAINLVTTNDELICCAEGLECILVECAFQANSGNLRRALVAIRRAMVIAQLMGIHRPGNLPVMQLDPDTRFHPNFVWFRLLFADRHLCMMLGLPQGSHDMSMINERDMANDTPIGRLERMHCAIASRILDHHEADPSSIDSGSIQELDAELRRAADSMPSKFWLPQNFAHLNAAEEIVFETTRLVTQLFHYSLLSQLHLPYMLRSSPERKYDYSKITCVNSSRESLTRFITFRSFNQVAYCCRMVDFIALMAAMTLLLAHLDGHRNKYDNFLLHQRFSDRAMVEKVLENMENLSKLNMDVLSQKSAEVLRSLLAIEADAAEGGTFRADNLPGSEMGSGEDRSNMLNICIPYFGTIKITTSDLIFKEAADPTLPPPPPPPPPPTSQPSEPRRPLKSPPANTLPAAQPQGRDLQSTSLLPHSQFGGGLHQAGSNTDQLQQSFPSFIDDSITQNMLYPGFTATTDDWAFQGVDTAFFDSLMSGANSGQEEGQRQDFGGGEGRGNPYWVFPS